MGDHTSDAAVLRRPRFGLGYAGRSIHPMSFLYTAVRAIAEVNHRRRRTWSIRASSDRGGEVRGGTVALGLGLYKSHDNKSLGTTRAEAQR